MMAVGLLGMWLDIYKKAHFPGMGAVYFLLGGAYGLCALYLILN